MVFVIYCHRLGFFSFSFLSSTLGRALSWRAPIPWSQSQGMTFGETKDKSPTKRTYAETNLLSLIFCRYSLSLTFSTCLLGLCTILVFCLLIPVPFVSHIISTSSQILDTIFGSWQVTVKLKLISRSPHMRFVGLGLVREPKLKIWFSSNARPRNGNLNSQSRISNVLCLFRRLWCEDVICELILFHIPPTVQPPACHFSIRKAKNMFQYLLCLKIRVRMKKFTINDVILLHWAFYKLQVKPRILHTYFHRNTNGEREWCKMYV